MNLKVVEKFSTTVIEVKGNLVGGPEAAEFNDLLHKLIDEGKKNVIADLNDVKFMNSSGIGILVRGYTTMKNGGGELKLAKVTEKIKGVLFITKLNQVFDIQPTVEKAAQSFGNS